MSTNTCGIHHKISSTTVGCSFAECQTSSVQWDKLRCTEQRAALLHSALTSNRLDICGLFTISRYMWCYLDVLLASGHCFWVDAFPGLTIGRLTVFSLSVDLKEAATWSSVLYNTTVVVCQGRHLARAHHVDRWLLLQQFMHRLKLIAKPKGAYNGTGYALGGTYIRNYMVSPTMNTIPLHRAI